MLADEINPEKELWRAVVCADIVVHPALCGRGVLIWF